MARVRGPPESLGREREVREKNVNPFIVWGFWIERWEHTNQVDRKMRKE